MQNDKAQLRANGGHEHEQSTEDMWENSETVIERYQKVGNVGILFPWQPTQSCFDFENMAERFPEWAWILRCSVHISQWNPYHTLQVLAALFIV